MSAPYENNIAFSFIFGVKGKIPSLLSHKKECKWIIVFPWHWPYIKGTNVFCLNKNEQSGVNKSAQVLKWLYLMINAGVSGMAMLMCWVMLFEAPTYVCDKCWRGCERNGNVDVRLCCVNAQLLCLAVGCHSWTLTWLALAVFRHLFFTLKCHRELEQTWRYDMWH